MNKVLVALLSAFTVFAASAATPTAAPDTMKPVTEAAAPVAKPAAAHKAQVKKVKHSAHKKAMKQKVAEPAAPKV